MPVEYVIAWLAQDGRVFCAQCLGDQTGDPVQVQRCIPEDEGYVKYVTNASGAEWLDKVCGKPCSICMKQIERPKYDYIE